MGKLFYLRPLGAVSKSLCRDVGEMVEEMFGLPVEVGPRLTTPVAAYNPLRGQYMAFRLLEFLSGEEVPAETFRTVGLIDLDLCTPVLEYVFGLARLNGGECVVSTYRLRPEHQGLPANRDLLLERLGKEVLHELGHTLGLRHCADKECIMNLVHAPAQVDGRRAGFCGACRDEAEARVSGLRHED